MVLKKSMLLKKNVGLNPVICEPSFRNSVMSFMSFLLKIELF